MSTPTRSRPPSSPGRAAPNPRSAQAERFELLEHLQAVLEPLMVALGLVFLVLLLIDFSGVSLNPMPRAWLDRAMTAIWVAFFADFALRLVVAPSKLGFLRENWLTAISLMLPFLRPLRALRALRSLRALRAVRSLSLVRLIGGVNRGMRVLRRVTRGRQFAYVGALSALVTLAGAVGVLYFDRDVEGATIRSFGDALWWAAAMVTTINNEAYAVSPEARVIALLVRVFAVSVFGFVTAWIASYLIGKDAEERARAEPPPAGNTLAGLREELAALRRENSLLRQDLAEIREAVDRQTAGPVTGTRSRGAPNGAHGAPPSARSPLAAPRLDPGGERP